MRDLNKDGERKKNICKTLFPQENNKNSFGSLNAIRPLLLNGCKTLRKNDHESTKNQSGSGSYFFQKKKYNISNEMHREFNGEKKLRILSQNWQKFESLQLNEGVATLMKVHFLPGIERGCANLWGMGCSRLEWSKEAVNSIDIFSELWVQ